MLISKTPYRISLFGGGTDLPQYYDGHKFGQVIGFTINKYSFIHFKTDDEFLDNEYRIVYTIEEKKKLLNLILHPSVRETTKYFKYKKKFQIVHFGDLPAFSGMGSSSAFTVGLSKIYRKLLKLNTSKLQIANDAIYIEQKLIKETVGSQDQVFASYGNIRKLIFKKNKIINKKINLSEKNKQKLENSCTLVYSGIKRVASDLEKQKFSPSNKFKNIEYLHKIKNIVDEGYKEFLEENINIKKIGNLLNKSWELKKNLAKNITVDETTKIINLALTKGAYGCKVLGAGGGGFVLIMHSAKKRNEFLKAFKNYNVFNFKIDIEGSKVIY